MSVAPRSIVTRYQAIGKRPGATIQGLDVRRAIALTRGAAKARPMTARECDIAIVGGGLAGGLIALALARLRPDIVVQVLEGGDVLGGNHRWSWFDSDLTDEGRGLIEAFRLIRWDAGYDVRFPRCARTLATPYRSLASADFADALARLLPAGTIRTGADARALDRGGVTLASGERIAARTVIDCRGFAPSPHLTRLQCSWAGHLRTHRAARVTRPVIHGRHRRAARRLPLHLSAAARADEVFVEDTYIRTPHCSTGGAFRTARRILPRAGMGGTVLGRKPASAVVTGGDFAAFQRAQRIEGVATAGVRGGFTHPLTSYTLPFAVQTALAVAGHADLAGEQLAALLEERARRHWAATRFYRRLGAMLFGAPPTQRRRVFERFYGLDQALIERFYAGRSTLLDAARVLVRGKPPGPLSALAANQPRGSRGMTAEGKRACVIGAGFGGLALAIPCRQPGSPPRWSRRATSPAAAPTTGSRTGSRSTPARPSSPTPPACASYGR